ncbi:hypothetical protein FH142_10460 [Staphylococcus warneri]|nr:hypothetical protein [Staphylococcus warneri]MCI2789884.1 hypothetical protein [Staphylococcus warneri]
MVSISKLLKSILIIIVIGVIVGVTSFILNSQKPADEKIKGVWKYDYNENKSLYFKSDDSGMYVGNIGDKIEVFPLKGNDKQSFNFLVVDNNDKKYIFKVNIKDKDHIVVTPLDAKKHSLAEIIYGTDSLNKKAKEDVSIELRKSK